MCKGTFRYIKPTIEAFLNSPFIEKPARVYFLIDTGSDKVALSEEDAQRMGIKYKELEKTQSFGISGNPTPTYLLPEVDIIFTDFSNIHNSIHLHTETLDNISIIEGLKINLLGMELLKRFNIVIDYTEQKIELLRSEFGEGSHLGQTVQLSSSP
jgi:predicted aspartyl protease